MLQWFSILILRAPLVFYCEPVIEDWFTTRLKVNVVRCSVGQKYTSTLPHKDQYLELQDYIMNEQHSHLYIEP